MYLENNGMLVDPKDVPDGLDPTFYIGLDRNFEIDIRTKINKEIKDIKDLERQLEEARDLLLQVQDSMSNLSTHSHEGWAIACADDTFNMIEQYVDVIELKEKGE